MHSELEARVAGRLPSGRNRHDFPREFVAQSQRERLLEGMARAVAAKGYRAATVADALKLAGVSRKTFYEHFSDKEECYLASYDAIVPRFLERIEQGYNSVEPWPQRIRAALDAVLRFGAAEPDFARACLVEVMAAGPAAIERRDAVMSGLAGYFDPKRPEMPRELAEPELVAESVIDALYGMIYTRIVRGQAAELPRFLPDLTYVALLPYLGDEGAKASADSS